MGRALESGAALSARVMQPLYSRIMGHAWEQMAEPIRAAHSPEPSVHAHGRLRIEHGRGLARLIAWLLRLPRPATAAETRLIITARAGGEHWCRMFNGQRLATWQYTSRDGALAERYGILEFRFRLKAFEGGLVYLQRDAALLLGSMRIRIPSWWAPRVEAREDPAGPNRFKLTVCATLPGIGRVIAYAGVIELDDTRS